MRRLTILLIPFVLFACQPKEAEVTEAQKAALAEAEVVKAEELQEDSKDVEVAKEGLKDELPMVCPPSTVLKDGQCLCNGAPLKLSDARSWLCVGEPGQFSDCPGDTWFCATVGGCKHGDAVCGFGGKLENGICSCWGADKAPDEVMLGDYRCQNDYWICDKKGGCGDAETACAYGETCFSPVAHCFGVELREDLAKYRCEDKLWTCRHSDGCRCGGELVPFGTHCRDSEAYCDIVRKPNKGNYKCVGACVPQLTASVYHWICQDFEGCPCGEGICGFGATCTDGECFCGEDDAPEAMAQYRCYSERALGVSHSEIESLGYWICNREAGCRCGDKLCTMGESCNDDGKCEMRDPDRPTYYEDFVYENEQWTCNITEGCRCGDTLCASDRACIEGQCTCRSDQDCVQSVCNNGRCDKAQTDMANAPKHPGYALENEAWICRNYRACVCGGDLCSDGAECREGKCFCGTDDSRSLANPATYNCKDEQWICEHIFGCICGSSFAPSGSICRDGQVYCGDTLVENGRGYHCHEVSGKTVLKCGASEQGGSCACGEHRCPPETICKDGQCYCDDNETPHLADANGYRYACRSNDFYCNQDACKCGDSDCGRGGRCKNDRCVCGPDDKTAPKDAASYACTESIYDYECDQDFEAAWRCKDEAGCACDDKRCGQNGICDADKNCRCGKSPAPTMNPEKYFCNYDSLWACNDKEGCAFSGGTCPYRHHLNRNKCITPPYLAEAALDAKRENERPEFCQGNKRPLTGDYECVDHAYGLGAAERVGWTCREDEGCTCGDDKNVDICRSSCVKTDDDGNCLTYTWYGQYLPICDGPRAVGSDNTNVDSCNDEGILRKPSSPGYSCHKGAWICTDALCTCRLAPCPKGHYCIGDSHCTL